MSNEKILYKGTFNWHGETLVLYKYAKSSGHALSLMITTLSSRLGYERNYVSNYFMNDKKDNYKMEEVKER